MIPGRARGFQKISPLRPSVCLSVAGESAAMVYRDLKQLSRLFKDQLAYPLIASARQGESVLCLPYISTKSPWKYS